MAGARKSDRRDRNRPRGVGPKSRDEGGGPAARTPNDGPRKKPDGQNVDDPKVPAGRKSSKESADDRRGTKPGRPHRSSAAAPRKAGAKRYDPTKRPASQTNKRRAKKKPLGAKSEPATSTAVALRDTSARRSARNPVDERRARGPRDRSREPRRGREGARPRGEAAAAPSTVPNDAAPRVHPRPSPDARARLAARLAQESGEAEPLGPARTGTVALIGRPNVGKSTLLNAALEQPLAIVTSTPQTTRDTILGVVHVGNAEIALLDTPGLHKARSQLSRAMNRSARSAAKSADVVVFVTDIPIRAGADARGPLRPMPGDLSLLADIGDGQPTVLVINKVDRARDKSVLLPLIEALSAARSFAAIVPISAKKENGVVRVLDEVAKLLPEGEHRFGEDDITDRPTRFFAAEYVREQVLLATKEEVPHATAVTIEAFEEKPNVMRIAATIHVEREGQKKILVGAAGQMLREIGTKARARIEALLECPVYLELFVRVTPDWRETPSLLEELGYGDRDSDSDSPRAAEDLEEPS